MIGSGNPARRGREMKKIWLVIFGSCLFSFPANAQSPFYQGKTIRVIVGTPPGNLYDFWARLIVEYMGKHIPGNPTFIVQNMPGAGHVVESWVTGNMLA